MSRRGFTLLETVLAIALGSLVLAASLSMLIVVQRAQAGVFNRADSNSEIARVHRTMQRAFSSLVVLPTRPAGSDSTSTAGETGDSPPDEGSTDSMEEPPPAPRLALSPGPRYPSSDLQRLELVLSAPPIPTDPTRAAENAWADEVLELDRPADDTAGLRGAFVLAEPATDEDAPARPDGWALWWIPREGERVQVATGLRSLRWVVARSEQGIVDRLSEYSATYTADLPDFIEVEIETTTGARSSLMFEIGWSISEAEDPSGAATPGAMEGSGDEEPSNDGFRLQPGDAAPASDPSGDVITDAPGARGRGR